MKICETFTSICGEISVGRFAFFIRLSGCPLNCVWCDTDYAKSGGVEIAEEELVEQAVHFPCVVITGGEPFLQKEAVAKFVKKLIKEKPNIRIEIETNGTIRPVEVGKYKNVVFNVSIKLKNSGNDYKDRIKTSVIDWFISVDANFKFVVASEDDIDEVNMLVKDFGIPKGSVWLMPEGKTKEEQEQKMLPIVERAKMLGYNFSPRFHVLLWGDKRGV